MLIRAGFVWCFTEFGFELTAKHRTQIRVQIRIRNRIQTRPLLSSVHGFSIMLQSNGAHKIFYFKILPTMLLTNIALIKITGSGNWIRVQDRIRVRTRIRGGKSQFRIRVWIRNTGFNRKQPHNGGQGNLHPESQGVGNSEAQRVGSMDWWGLIHIAWRQCLNHNVRGWWNCKGWTTTCGDGGISRSEPQRVGII